jgi:ABC-type Na+ transport system ATPase subunit NatA
MLTGDTEPNAGTAYVNGNNILTNLDQARRNIGYCPQFDALNPLLTGREHLKLYARLRGLSENSVQIYTEWCLKRLGLTPYADRAAGTYSGTDQIAKPMHCIAMHMLKHLFPLFEHRSLAASGQSVSHREELIQCMDGTKFKSHPAK